MTREVKAFFIASAISVGTLAVTFGAAEVVQSQRTPAASIATDTNSVATVDFSKLEGQAKIGYQLFDRNCAHCHGDDARGDEGPDLHGLVKSDARISKVIREGVKNEMPKFGRKFSDTDVQALIAFLRTLKD
jgi:mono/diheme cytochrome c family protein